MQMWHLEMWLSDRVGSAPLTVELNDLKGLLQSELFYSCVTDSVSRWILYSNLSCFAFLYKLE